MLTRAGAKLLDFGLARPAPDGGGSRRSLACPTAKPHDRPLTEQGTILGTFQYMAPEQLEGQAADARTDIFALGAVLYEMATGRKAFEGKSRTSLIAAIVSSQTAERSPASMPLTPPALDHVIRKCLEKDPDDRWQSARDVAAELQWVVARAARGPGCPRPCPRGGRTASGWPGRRRRWPSSPPSRSPSATRGARHGPGRWCASSSPRRDDRRPRPAASSLRTAVCGLRRHGRRRPAPDLGPRPRRPRAAAGAGHRGRLRPIWSPDSRHSRSSRAESSEEGGHRRRARADLCDAPTGADGSWSPQGVILFDGRSTIPSGRRRRRRSAPGSRSRRTARRYGAGWPEFLPDGRHYIAALRRGTPTT